MNNFLKLFLDLDSFCPGLLCKIAPMKTKNIESQQWWDSLSDGERRLICSVMRMLRGAKRSQILEVARAAVKWERGIGCFIKVRLMSACRTGHQKPCVRITVKPVTSSPSTSRSQSGASPNLD